MNQIFMKAVENFPFLDKSVEGNALLQSSCKIL